MTVVRELATLLGVGVPLLEALDTLARQHTGAMARALLAVRERVAGGASLAMALREEAGLFDELALSMVEVGEASGNLESVLERLADFKEHWQRLRGRILTVLLYPIVVLGVGAVVTLFLMTFVIPKILDALQENGRDLPLLTRWVKGASDLLLGQGYLLAIAAVGIWVVWRVAMRRPAAKLARDGLWLRLPLIGPLVHRQQIVRIATALSCLLGSGLPFVQALAMAQRATRNLVLQEALRRCQRAVTAGADIARRWRPRKCFRPWWCMCFALGQQSGRLDTLLQRLANSYEQQVQTSAARLTTILEPLLIILIAVVIGAIALATMLPILEAGNVL